MCLHIHVTKSVPTSTTAATTSTTMSTATTRQLPLLLLLLPMYYRLQMIEAFRTSSTSHQAFIKTTATDQTCDGHAIYQHIGHADDQFSLPANNIEWLPVTLGKAAVLLTTEH